MKSDEDIVSELERLTAGLLFMSESDYPFEIVYWKGLQEMSAQYLRGLTATAEEVPVESVSVDRFFRVGMNAENRQTDESRLEAQKYRDLVQLLKDNLDKLKVYRVGKINIPVYIIGRSPSGNWLGIATRVVET
jgi:hypothetical protein